MASLLFGRLKGDSLTAGTGKAGGGHRVGAPRPEPAAREQGTIQPCSPKPSWDLPFFFKGTNSCKV